MIRAVFKIYLEIYSDRNNVWNSNGFRLNRTFRVLPSLLGPFLSLFFFFFFFFLVRVFLKSLFIYFERKTEKESEQGRGRERNPSRLRTINAEPDVGLKPTNCEIMTWAEAGCLTDWATQAPLLVSFLTDIYFVLAFSQNRFWVC